jgi:lambda family phage portal protein
MSKGNWLDRAISAVSPQRGLIRAKARALLSARASYDGATQGRRAASWQRRGTDANAELSPAAQQALRAVSHEMVRNNAYAARGVQALAENIVGAGITFHIMRAGKIDKTLTDLARAHFDTTACDAEGRHNLYGLQLLAARACVASGGALLRRRWRRLGDGLPVPMQVQLLEPEYINMSLSGSLPNGGYRLWGIEFNQIGKRTGYQMYAGHPGSSLPGMLSTKLVPASDVIHLFRADRPEQQHGAPWFAPVVLRLKDFGEYVDAQVVRQKIAAAYSAFIIGDAETDPTPEVDSNGNAIDISGSQEYLEPGLITHLSGGNTVEFGSPPSVDGYAEVSRITMQEIAAGLGLPYELLTGDLSNVSFISGRLGRLNFKRSVETWQWLMFIPQFCDPLGAWWLEAAATIGHDVAGAKFVWSPPTFEMMDPASEVPATRDAIRAGLTTLPQAIRDRGFDPDTVIAERAAFDKQMDGLGIVVEADPRKVTQVGNAVIIPNADQRLGGTAND